MHTLIVQKPQYRLLYRQTPGFQYTAPKWEQENSEH